MKALAVLVLVFAAFSGGIWFSSWQAREYQCTQFEDGSAYCVKSVDSDDGTFTPVTSGSTTLRVEQTNSTPDNLQPAASGRVIQTTINGNQLQGN